MGHNTDKSDDLYTHEIDVHFHIWPFYLSWINVYRNSSVSFRFMYFGISMRFSVSFNHLFFILFFLPLFACGALNTKSSIFGMFFFLFLALNGNRKQTWTQQTEITNREELIINIWLHFFLFLSHKFSHWFKFLVEPILANRSNTIHAHLSLSIFFRRFASKICFTT